MQALVCVCFLWSGSSFSKCHYSNSDEGTMYEVCVLTTCFVQFLVIKGLNKHNEICSYHLFCIFFKY